MAIVYDETVTEDPVLRESSEKPKKDILKDFASLEDNARKMSKKQAQE
jgi:hypothetical protein